MELDGQEAGRVAVSDLLPCVGHGGIDEPGTGRRRRETLFFTCQHAGTSRATGASVPGRGAGRHGPGGG